MALADDVYLYSRTTGANVATPFNGRIVADVEANAIFELPALLWSTPLQLLGGDLGLSATLAAGGPAIDAGVSLTGPAGNVHGRLSHCVVSDHRQRCSGKAARDEILTLKCRPE
jgi:hypothetical protein